MKSTRFSSVLAVLLAASLAAACGSSSGGSTSAGASGSSKASSDSGSITVGIISPIGTSSYVDPYSPAAVRAAARAFNASGGLDGHKVVVDYCNDMGTPNQTLICARQMVSNHAIAVVGGSVLSDSVEVATLKAAGIPMVGFNPFTQFNSPNEFLLSGGSALGFQWLTAYVVHKQIPTAFIEVENSTAAAMKTALDQVATKSGGKYKTTVLVSPTQADFAPSVSAASVAKAAILFLGTAQDDEFIKAGQSAGDKLIYLESGPLGPNDIKAIGKAATNNVEIASPFLPITSSSTNPLIQQYFKDMSAEAAAGDSAADQATAGGSQSFQAWLSMQVIKDVVTQDHLTNPTASSLMSALNSAHNINLGGVIPAWTPSQAGPLGFTRVSNTSYYLEGYRNGQPYLISPTPVTLAKAVAGDF